MCQLGAAQQPGKCNSPTFSGLTQAGDYSRLTRARKAGQVIAAFPWQPCCLAAFGHREEVWPQEIISHWSVLLCFLGAGQVKLRSPPHRPSVIDCPDRGNERVHLHPPWARSQHYPSSSAPLP